MPYRFGYIYFTIYYTFNDSSVCVPIEQNDSEQNVSEGKRGKDEEVGGGEEVGLNKAKHSEQLK